MDSDFYHAYTVLNMAKSQLLELPINCGFYAEKIAIPDEMNTNLDRYLSLLERWKIIDSTVDGWHTHHGYGNWTWNRTVIPYFGG